jgi:hypothetical protein
MPIHLERPDDGLSDPPRENDGVLGLAHPREDDGELVAAEACHRVGSPGAAAQPFRHCLQQLVAHRMAEGIVHGFEMIEIEAEHRQGLSSPDPPEIVLKPHAQQHAIGQIGERIVTRHVRDALFGPLSLRDVLMRRQPPAARQRLVDDQEHAAVTGFDDVARRFTAR